MIHNRDNLLTVTAVIVAWIKIVYQWRAKVEHGTMTSQRQRRKFPSWMPAPAFIQVRRENRIGISRYLRWGWQSFDEYVRVQREYEIVKEHAYMLLRGRVIKCYATLLKRGGEGNRDTEREKKAVREHEGKGSCGQRERSLFYPHSYKLSRMNADVPHEWYTRETRMRCRNFRVDYIFIDQGPLIILIIVIYL